MFDVSEIQRLSREGKDGVRWKILSNRSQRVKVDRPSWDTYLMNIARAASLRSPDSQTKVGCVIVNDKFQILGTGYNGPVAGINDNYVPNIRPSKYLYYLHAEINTLASCTHKPEGGKVYLNMRPCCKCLQTMAQFGISEVIYEDNKPVMCQDADEEINFEIVKALLENKLILRVFKDDD